MSGALPDLLVPGLDVAFVNINPAIYSVERGHYFARKSNKFWPCISASRLTLAMRTELGVERLGPEHDVLLPRFGIGFTDLVARPTARASDVSPAEFVAGAAILLKKLERFAPRIACFQGITGYRIVRDALPHSHDAPALGLQPERAGPTRLFLVPNPSGANAHFTRAQQTYWYDRLHDCATEKIASSRGSHPDRAGR
ncbi:MAG TPA: mismatch-specific DNA-glycosylase [Candidatus Tumulicola sp.]